LSDIKENKSEGSVGILEATVRALEAVI